MDVQQNNTRERVFSILNDNDCPSFVIRQKQLQQLTSPKPTRLPSIHSLSPRRERPHFLRQTQYERNSSISSSSAGSPPLLRYDSASSSKSSSSMDSTPSPITPAYHYNEPAATAYDSLLRQDMGLSYLPSPTTITPFMESQMLISPNAATQLPAFEPKAMINGATGYVGLGVAQPDVQQLPTPTLTNHTSNSSVSSTVQSKTSPASSSAAAAAAPGKKNKYPCPYSASHNCMATFTTSGHAARHGKKHTGEKGVHCPICNKAFTRKDNMKQHERTHKNQGIKHGGEDNRSKAAVTKEAQKAKAHKKTESVGSSHARRSSLLQSPVSDVNSLAPNTIDTPVNMEASFFQDPSPTILATDPSLGVDAGVSSSLYPPLSDDSLISPLGGPHDKLDVAIPLPPTLIRGFSDLDTLAQAAESFDNPYYQNQF